MTREEFVPYLLAQVAERDAFMTVAGIPFKVNPRVPVDEMWAVHDDARTDPSLDTRIVPNTFVVTRGLGQFLQAYQREQFRATGYLTTLVLVAEETAHAMLSLAEWFQVKGDAPIWPIPVSRLGARARVGQAEIDG